MATYPYVQARYDFGVRKGPTYGLMLHGSESEAGLVGYLTHDPARNVSANFVCERSGRMVQMLPIDHASGSLNPNDRSTNKAYYGHDHLVDVLGTWWTNPNSVVISVEIEMFAAKGPNAEQVASLIAWAADMRHQFPSIRGALGHADQTDTKGCPGSTPAIKSVFAAIGGHGLFTAEEPMVKFTAPADEVGGTITTKTATLAIPLSGGNRPSLPVGVKRPALGVFTLDELAARPCYLMLVGTELCFVAAAAVDFTPDDGPNPPATVEIPKEYAVLVGGKSAGTVVLP